MIAFPVLLLAALGFAGNMIPLQGLDSPRTLVMIGCGLVGLGMVSAAAWQKSRSCFQDSFDEVKVGDQLVDLHEYDWREYLHLSEPYRIVHVRSRPRDTNDKLCAFAAKHGQMYTNKYLMVRRKRAESRLLICMACYDLSTTYVVHVEVGHECNPNSTSESRPVHPHGD